MKKCLAFAVSVLLVMSACCALAADTQSIADEVRGFLVSDNWKFDIDEELNAFVFSANIEGRMKSVNYIVPIREDYYIVYAISPVHADVKNKSMMSRMMEFICRANYGLRNGNFDMDMKDGEIRYRVFVDCSGGVLPSREVIGQSIITPLQMFERYSPGLLDVVQKGKSAAEAIRQCEK